ncbi:MAG TPA: fumarylacetoacetate hydrolase family protein, partial [Gemmatimonadaceae bacterium]|nr:fumarylacetoacetate hydrolase family protein [Gemmatimonadaceae bacterium]
MRWTTLRRGSSTYLAERVDDHYVVYDRPSVSALFAGPTSQGEVIGHVTLEEAEYAPLVGEGARVVCVGLNYADHVLEMGREVPEFPTLFAKFGSALTGPRDDIA